jgi:hypothetical protein
MRKRTGGKDSRGGEIARDKMIVSNKRSDRMKSMPYEMTFRFSSILT